jgi:carbonic anhydrase/acetyltransferase-like protein (isoleucine patch superfamily)
MRFTMIELGPRHFFKLDGQNSSGLFKGLDHVWDALDMIGSFLKGILSSNVAEIRRQGDMTTRPWALWNGQAWADDLTITYGDATKGKLDVWRKGQRLEGAAVVSAGVFLMDDAIEIGPGALVEPGALIKGPALIGPETEVRQGAYLRGNCLTGRGAVVGHVTEMKNTVMLDGAKAGHFAYLGDSLLGREVNLGAGTKLANLKILPGPIRIRVGEEIVAVDRRKFGAILGDDCQTGCNSVTSPGTLMGPRCLVAPNLTVPGGYHPPRTVLRGK